MITGKKPLLFDEVLRDNLINRIKAGSYIKSACQAEGISESVFYHWIQKAEGTMECPDGERREIYISFLESLKIARSQYVCDTTARIDRAGKKDWQALAWILERTDPALFAKRVEVAIGASPILRALQESAKRSLLVEQAPDGKPKDAPDGGIYLPESMLAEGKGDVDRQAEKG